jgi:hypothetical protein
MLVVIGAIVFGSVIIALAVSVISGMFVTRLARAINQQLEQDGEPPFPVPGH